MPPDFATKRALPGHVSAREQLPPTMKPSPACAPRGGEPSLRRRRNDSLPLSLRRAFRAPPSTRCATTVCAAARRVQPHLLVGRFWQACRDPLWLPYDGLLKLATSAVRASARGLLSLGSHIAHKSVSLPSAHFFLPLRGAGRLSAQKVLREGGRAENDCRYVQQV